MRLNLGCGKMPLADWVNIDDDPDVHPDQLLSVPPLPMDDESVEEIYMGHFLEHFHPATGAYLIRECRRVLVPGGRLGVVVPDFHKIVYKYLCNQITPGEMVDYTDKLEYICDKFIYSYVQKSIHRWCYDRESLSKRLMEFEFININAIDCDRDPRVFAPAWWQFGLDSYKGK